MVKGKVEINSLDREENNDNNVPGHLSCYQFDARSCFCLVLIPVSS